MDPLCFLNFLLILGAAEFSLSLRQWFMSKGIIYTKFIIINIEQLHELVLISMLSITY